jgi:hypothetical protein
VYAPGEVKRCDHSLPRSDEGRLERARVAGDRVVDRIGVPPHDDISGVDGDLVRT